MLLRLADEVSETSSAGALAGRVLTLCAEATGADGWVVLRAESDGAMSALAERRDGTRTEHWPGAAAPLSRPCSVSDLGAQSWTRAMPATAQGYRSLLSVPIALSIGPPLALVLLSRRAAFFTQEDRRLMDRVATLVGPVMERLSLADRGSLGPGSDWPPDGGAGDTAPPGRPVAPPGPLTALMAEVKRWQTRIFDITNAILTARIDAVDDAITSALDLTGTLALADRTYVFLRRDPARLDNTHEWVAEGIEPMIAHLQDMPDEVLDEWRPALQAGQEIEIPDVDALPDPSEVKSILQAQGIKSLLALPMLDRGRLLGFVGYDSVRRHRAFRSFEIQLLRSVADAISVMIVWREAERRAETQSRALKYQNTVLKATLAAIPQLILETGPDGRFVGFNEGSSMGPVYAPDAFIGKLPEEVLPPEAARTWWSAIEQVRRTGECRDVLLSVEVDGAERDFIVSGGRLTAEGAEPGCVFIAREVTEERRRDRERVRLAKIAELTSSHVLILDGKGLVEWINPAFASRMGVKLDTILGRDGVALLGVMMSDPAGSVRLRAALQAGESIQTLLKLHDATGAVFWMALDMQAIRAEGGEIEGFVLVQSEVTSLKESEETALREKAMALDIATDGFAVADAEGMFTYMNAAHKTVFGIDPEEDISGLSWRDLYAPEGVAEIERTVMPVLQETGHWRGRLTGRHRSGAKVPQQVALNLMEGGRLLCAMRDISAEIAWNLERARLSDALGVAQRGESISRIASEAAHDLNNMIAVVRGTATMLRPKCVDRPDALEGLARIERAMDAAGNFVTDLQSLERAPVPKAVHDLRAIVGDALVILGPDQIYAHHVATHLPEREQPVYCASIDLMQVMMNLIWNACEAKSEGASSVTIEVLEEYDSGADFGALMVGDMPSDTPCAVFRITDDGDGIAPDLLSRIFTRFFTTKGQRGTGMGLPIVSRMIERNHAALWIDSAPGRGTSITVAWPSTEPVLRLRERPARPEGNPGGDGASAPDLSGLSVMVVDDYAEAAQMMADALSDAGAFAMALSDAAEAREILDTCPETWSVVVVDLDMPQVSGIDIARALQAHRIRPPCVLVTARPNDVGANAHLFEAILAKPLGNGDLVGTVRKAAWRQRCED
ncbi:PAS domain S-box protein [Histidinibacterium lentulum]|uniref:histidine kinase n=1 Tax=Histidinibacterium lentulum TaxID=2480588 RepID=A0A3N2QL22_9RHOB|nr:PAS domain S-box protein [Histidinibacterium lentulum]